MTTPPQPSYAILIGTSEAGGYVGALAAGFRALGHAVTTAMCYGLTHYNVEYDIHIPHIVNAVDWQEVRARLTSPTPEIPDEITDDSSPLEIVLWLIHTHDIFVFLFTSLWHDAPSDDDPFAMGLGREFRLLKELGKRIIVVATGDDLRHMSALDQQLVWADPRATRIAPLIGSRDSWLRPLRNLRRAERWADVIASQPNMAGLAVRPYMHFFAPIDVRSLRPAYPDREVPVIVHTPSICDIKGTSFLLGALDRLRQDQVPFVFRLFQGIPNREVLAEMRRADIVVDQLLAPHGTVAVEGLASGCAVATYDNRRLEPWPEQRPLWPIDPGTAVDQLRILIPSRELRGRLAREGRRYALAHHDRVSVARGLLDRLEAGSAATWEHYPDFFFTEYRLPEGEQVPPPLQGLTSEVVRRWGLPQALDLRELVARGLLTPEVLIETEAIPRWPVHAPVSGISGNGHSSIFSCGLTGIV